MPHRHNLCFQTNTNLSLDRIIVGEPLHPVDAATTVPVGNGQMQLYDGPFAETKEPLAGFYLIDAKDLNEAIQIASGIPPAKYGSIEVRPVRQLNVGNAREQKS
jgi:hypothetical protein